MRAGRQRTGRPEMVAATAAITMLLPLAGCGGEDEQTLTVLAAASLTETFADLAATFEEEHPGVEVELVFGSSQMLAEQLADGAPGDVLATADERSMRLAEDGNAVADGPHAFASNHLTLVTPPDNPAGITSLDDLDDPGVSYVVCAAATPCGAIASELLAQAQLTRDPVSEEVDVKAVLAKVRQQEADAGIVYRTDALAAGDDVHEVPLPQGLRTNYFVAPTHTDSAERQDLAAEFVTLVRSNRARSLLQDAGFEGVVAQ